MDIHSLKEGDLALATEARPAIATDFILISCRRWETKWIRTERTIVKSRGWWGALTLLQRNGVLKW